MSDIKNKKALDFIINEIKKNHTTRIKQHEMLLVDVDTNGYLEEDYVNKAMSEDDTNECIYDILQDSVSLIDCDVEILDNQDSLTEIFGTDGYDAIRDAESTID